MRELNVIEIKNVNGGLNPSADSGVIAAKTGFIKDVAVGVVVDRIVDALFGNKNNSADATGNNKTSAKFDCGEKKTPRIEWHRDGTMKSARCEK